MTYKKLSKEQIYSVIKMKNDGMYNNQIAKIFQVPHWVISYTLRKHNLKSFKILDKETIKKVLSLHDSGKNNTEIAKHIGVTDAAIGKILKRNYRKTNLRRIDNIEKQIINLYEKGLTCREISKIIGFTDTNVGLFLKRKKLPLNRYRAIEMIDEKHAKCSRCEKTEEILNWPMNGKNYYSYCRACFNKRINLNKQKNPFKIRFYHIRKRCYRENIVFNITSEYLEDLWNKQKGLCFYTDRPMSREIRANDPTSMSVDKIIPENGYTIGNIVLCQKRINTMKGDATLSEMELWMPEWWKRIQNYIRKDIDIVTMNSC